MRSLDRRRRYTRQKPTPVWNAQGPVLWNGGGARHYKEATVSRNQAVEADCPTGVVPGVLQGIGHRNSMTIGGPILLNRVMLSSNRFEGIELPRRGRVGDSVASEHPIEYTVTISQDQAPQIALLEPAGRADLPSDMRLDMLARKVAQPKLHTAEDRQPFRTLWAKLF